MGNALFACAYRLYLTGIGRSRHNSQLNGVRTSNVHPHSKFAEAQGAQQFLYDDIQIIPIPFLDDNLAYLVIDKTTQKYFLVDPADFLAVEEVKQAYGITSNPEAVLSTHKHWDHAGHNERFVEAYPGIRIISGTNEPVYMSNEDLADGATLENLLDGKVTITAFETPCHTAAHNMFIMKVGSISEGVNRMIFTGDCLFEGGVGMFFEGVPAQMFGVMQNLFTKHVSQEQDRCALFFGHDYGFKNYLWAANHLFANRIPSANNQKFSELREQVERRQRESIERRREGFCSTGVLLSEEMQRNLFMVAYLQSQDEGEKPFLNWVLSDFTQFEDGAWSTGETGVDLIHRLRENRTSHDRPINEEAAAMRTQQAGLHKL